MIFDSLITSMNQVIVRDALAQFLANERDNQIQIAINAKNEANERIYTDKWIDQNVNFTVYPKQYRNIDASNCPCVILYFDNAVFDEGLQYPDSNSSEATLNCEMYAAGTNEVDDNEEIVKTCDANASDRLDYLLSQVYKILSSEAGFYKGTDGLVTKSVLLNWERIAVPQEKNEAETILGINLKYNLTFEEPTQQLTAVRIKELYFNLNIQDENINPYVKILLEDNNNGTN